MQTTCIWLSKSLCLKSSDYIRLAYRSTFLMWLSLWNVTICLCICYIWQVHGCHTLLGVCASYPLFCIWYACSKVSIYMFYLVHDSWEAVLYRSNSRWCFSLVYSMRTLSHYGISCIMSPNMDVELNWVFMYHVQHVNPRMHCKCVLCFFVVVVAAVVWLWFCTKPRGHTPIFICCFLLAGRVNT